MNKFFIKKLALIVGLTIIGGGIYYVYHQQHITIVQQSFISDYEPTRDRQSIIDYFEIDKYWLTADPQGKVAFNLDYKSPNKNSIYFGTLTIKVARQDDKFIGFTTYYKKSITRGYLLHLGVQKEFRGKGYGRKLVEYALNDLQHMGALTVDLFTRTNNFSALRLYNRLGFVETLRRDDGFMVLRKTF